MVLSASDLPDDVDALKAMIVAMNAEGAAARAEIARLEALKKDTDERIATLTAIVKVLERAQKGTGSERLRLGINDDQIDFAFEEVETGLSAIDSELDQSRKDKKREARPRKGFAAHLERIEEIIEPEIPEECRGLEKGSDWRGPIRAARCHSTEVPCHRDPPAQICIQGA